MASAGMLRALTAVLSLSILALLGLAYWQSMRITALAATAAQAEREIQYGVARLATESIRGRREEIARAATWLNEFYRSEEGLQRPDGLWLRDERRPDMDAIAVWIFDVYLGARLQGQSEDESRQAVIDQIRATDEWRRKH